VARPICFRLIGVAQKLAAPSWAFPSLALEAATPLTPRKDGRKALGDMLLDVSS
jgi:hypothetical protein